MDAEAIVDEALPDLEPERRATAERLVELVLAELRDAQHERKWGRLTFTLEEDWHHWICAVAVAKAAVKLVIHKGSLLADPHGALEGDGRYIRAISFTAPGEVDPDVVAPILREAAARQAEMLPGEPE